MEYSEEVLEATPARTTKFLAGIGALATVRTALAAAGMDDHEIEEGRTLLLNCLAAPRPVIASDTADAAAQRKATAELDQWDEPNFARFQATLRRHFPSAATYIFADLKAQTGAAAVSGIATFLARIDALEQGTDPDRKNEVEADKQAVALLAKRGLTLEERARLNALIQVALGPTQPILVQSSEQAQAARRNALVALKQWFDEWATTARAVIKKRGHLIRLGLAQRKTPERPPGADDDGEDQDPGSGGPASGPTQNAKAQ